MLLFLLPISIHASPKLEFEGESVYNYLRVIRDATGARALLSNEGEGVQSLYHPGRFLTGYYWDAAAFLPALNPAGKDFLILGTAGASSARIVAHFFPNLALTGVEIDPLMVKIAKQFFAADELPLTVHVADGRVFLQNEDKKYDFIMVDVYRDELYIPFHLATREFFEQVRDHLTPNGAVVMNIASLSAQEDLTNLLKNTVVSVFPTSYAYAAPNSYNTLLFAFQKQPDIQGLNLESLPFDLRALAANILREWQPLDFNVSADVSTDDRSPIELLTEKMVFSQAL